MYARKRDYVLGLGMLRDRIIAKYKAKKKVKSEDGGETTVYVYSEGQIDKRHKEKAQRLEKLRKSKSNLDTQIKKDLTADDGTVRGVALAVALMDATAERVGNEESADDGHVGVTGWTKEHISFKGGKATIKYTGKSGVKQHKEVTDKAIVSALKKACESAEGCVVGVSAEDVNAYLKEFDITAKDIRGLHANETMKENLRSVRKKGPKLPSDKKEREKLLKDEFKEALELTAEDVGHEASTLKSQYLVPSMHDDFMDDGQVNDSLTKKGTQTPSEREDAAMERKERHAPKVKPPRHDLRKSKPPEEDPDMQGLGKGDKGDPDFSRKLGTQDSPYTDARVVVALPATGSRSPTNMSKISPHGVKKMTADLERVASAVQYHHSAMGLPKKVAMDFAWSCDILADHLERRAGLRKAAKTAQFDPTENFTESENIPNRFDAAEIGMESSGPLMQDPDEPYMGVFVQDEFDQLREVQQTGMFSNAKAAAQLLRKLGNLLADKGIQLSVLPKQAKLPKQADEDSEEDEEDEGEEDKDAGKKAEDTYGLFG